MEDPIIACRTALYDALKKLQDAKPEERGEMARRFAVTITELEKVIGYYETWITGSPTAG